MKTSAKGWSRQLVDLTGKRVGALVVLNKAESQNRRVRWRCLCDCGKEYIATGHGLKEGFTKSCGCGLVGRRRFHSKRATACRLYSIWSGIMYRCRYTPHPRYRGRGIDICPEWGDNFDAFATWAEANGYRDDLTIDRINVDGHYEPANCRWIPMAEQINNRRNTRWVVVDGERMPMSVACRRAGLRRQTVDMRIMIGWPEERWFEPVKAPSSRRRSACEWPIPKAA